MRARIVIALSAALGGAALVSACAEEELLLAKLPPSEDAGPAVEAKRCIGPLDCSGQAFCARIRCGDLGGICSARPVVCEEESAPVCGCDGITYWNDCLRRAAGITAKTFGECEPDVAQTCGGQGDHGRGPGPASGHCPAGTFCARLLPPPPPGAPFACPPEVPGTCWALPAVCPSRSSPDRWTACRGTDLACRTTCDAIHDGEPHRRAIACP